ncbi:MAG: GNAT family N-acetyltransferase [Oscillospiraceae bacterium]|jgi:predicted acetyltransferase|nr:GNAT family N-acetyltransferase [Oscillospiraceae bacterium]
MDLLNLDKLSTEAKMLDITPDQTSLGLPTEDFAKTSSVVTGRLKLFSINSPIDESVRDKISKFRNEFTSQGDNLDGSAGLGEAASLDEWFAQIQDNSSIETVRENMVPASTYLALDQHDHIVGIADIRHSLNDYLLAAGGHIGYSVRPSQRRQGYGKEILFLALLKCRELGINRVLLSCDSENIASEKIILANGGQLENCVIFGDKVKKRYWIEL